MRFKFVSIAILSLIGLTGCQTSGVMTEESVGIKSEKAWLDLSTALAGVDTYSIEAEADWRQYSELHVFQDNDYYGEAWLGALQRRWQWNATDNAVDFRKQLAQWNRFKESPPDLGTIRKEKLDPGPMVYSIGQHRQDNCVYFMRFLGRNLFADTAYRVQVVGYICRDSGGPYNEDEALTILEQMAVRSTTYDGTGIPQDALRNP